MLHLAIMLLLAHAVLIAPVAASETSSSYDADVGLDPGHSRADVGSAGGGLAEYEVALDIAFRAKSLLEANGYRVTLSRTDHNPVSPFDHPDTLTERVRIEQEARIAAVGKVRSYVSIHFNGGPPSLRGTETYYNPENIGEQSYQLAEALQRHMVASLWEAGYATVERGVKSDLLAGKPYGHFFSLRGPQPSALVEALFLSNPTEAELLRRDDVRQRIAEAYSRGISEYLGAETALAAGVLERSDGAPNSR